MTPAVVSQLQNIGAELRRLSAMVDDCVSHGSMALTQEAQADVGQPMQIKIKRVLRARRLREQFLPAELFADPAWDMILDLMAARLAGQRVSVSSLCIAATVPQTTALRWIRQLTDCGVFSRTADPADGRRVFIELTDDAVLAFTAWANAVRFA